MIIFKILAIFVIFCLISIFTFTKIKRHFFSLDISNLELPRYTPTSQFHARRNSDTSDTSAVIMFNSDETTLPPILTRRNLGKFEYYWTLKLILKLHEFEKKNTFIKRCNFPMLFVGTRIINNPNVDALVKQIEGKWKLRNYPRKCHWNFSRE